MITSYKRGIAFIIILAMIATLPTMFTGLPAVYGDNATVSEQEVEVINIADIEDDSLTMSTSGNAVIAVLSADISGGGAHLF